MVKGKKGKHDRPKSGRVTRSQKRAMERSLSNTGHDDLNTQLKNLGLCTKNITGDGNCLFRALSDQYYGTDTHHEAIRQEVCDYLKRHEENYKFFVEDDQSFEHHVECMEQDATFGGNMELAAFAKMRAVDIKVYQPGMIYIINGREEGTGEDKEQQDEEEVEVADQTEIDMENDGELKPISQVLHIAYHSWEHYSSVRNIDGPYSGPPEIKVTKIGNGHVSDIAEGDEEEEDVLVETLDSKEKVVLSACPGTRIQKVRRLLKKYHGDPNKVIDKLYEDENKVQVVIESLDKNEPVHPLESNSSQPTTKDQAIVSDEKNTAAEEKVEKKEDIPESSQENDTANNKRVEQGDKEVKQDSHGTAIDEEEEGQKEKDEEKAEKKDEEPAEKKPKKLSNADKKREKKRLQKEQKIIKDRAKASRRSHRKQKESESAAITTTTDKPLATTHSMKEMYI